MFKGLPQVMPNSTNWMTFALLYQIKKCLEQQLEHVMYFNQIHCGCLTLLKSCLYTCVYFGDSPLKPVPQPCGPLWGTHTHTLRGLGLALEEEEQLFYSIGSESVWVRGAEGISHTQRHGAVLTLAGTTQHSEATSRPKWSKDKPRFTLDFGNQEITKSVSFHFF